MHLSQVIDGFFIVRRTRLAPTTQTNYRYCFQRLTNFLGPERDFASITASDIRAFVDHLHEDESSLRSPDDFFKRLSYLQWMEQEHMVVVLLNSKLKVISVETPHVGTVDTCQVRISELFKMTVRRNASQILLAYNHPSGDPEPSPLYGEKVKSRIGGSGSTDTLARRHYFSSLNAAAAPIVYMNTTPDSRACSLSTC